MSLGTVMAWLLPYTMLFYHPAWLPVAPDQPYLKICKVSIYTITKTMLYKNNFIAGNKKIVNHRIEEISTNKTFINSLSE